MAPETMGQSCFHYHECSQLQLQALSEKVDVRALQHEDCLRFFQLCAAGVR